VTTIRSAGERGDLVVVSRRRESLCEPLAAPVAEIRLGRPQVVPVGLRLDAQTFDRDEFPLDPEQPLDDALRLLIASFAEVVVADDAVVSTK
jgi:hypothetical protein